MKYQQLDVKRQSINEPIMNQVEIQTKRISFISWKRSRPHNTEHKTWKHVIGENEEHEPYQHLECESRYCGMVAIVLLLLQIPETIHERRKEGRIMTTTLIIRTGLPRYDDDLKAFVLI